MRGRLISPEGEPSLAPFPSPLGHGLYPRATSTLRGRVDPVRGAIDERQEELRERRDEIYHIKETLVHLEGELHQVVSSRRASSRIFLQSLKGIYSTLNDIEIAIARISAHAAEKPLPSPKVEASITESSDYAFRANYYVHMRKPAMDVSEAEVCAQIDCYIQKIVNSLREVGGDIGSLEYSIETLIQKKREAEARVVGSEKHLVFSYDTASHSCLVHPRKVTLAEIRAMIASEERIIAQLERQAPSILSEEKALQSEFDRLEAMRDRLIIRGNAAVDKINAIYQRKAGMKGDSCGPN